MAYESTSVSVPKSQEAIRKLISTRSSPEGTRIATVSDPPREGFSASVFIDNKNYHIRIMATRKAVPKNRTAKQQEMFKEQELRRIWRVLYHHLKSVFEAAESGVMEFKELMLPYIVMPNGMTIAEAVIPQLDAKLAGKPERLLTASNEGVYE
jgi:hypothetical protein